MSRCIRLILRRCDTINGIVMMKERMNGIILKFGSKVLRLVLRMGAVQINGEWRAAGWQMIFVI